MFFSLDFFFAAFHKSFNEFQRNMAVIVVLTRSFIHVDVVGVDSVNPAAFIHQIGI